MALMWIIVLSVLAEKVWSNNETSKANNLEFPKGFKFGAATASHQVEGAWNVSDKTPSIWDVYAHTKAGVIRDGSNGDVACDSYHLWKRDVEIAVELGIHFYRFSIAWPRLLPSGFSSHISEDGKKYYNNLINGLIDAGIEPVITIYHWELPQTLQDLGGWTNPLIVDWFADYARVAFTLFSDRVQTWITLNEPMVFCEATYTLGGHAPAILSPGIGNFLCNKYALLAHAKAWRIYDKEFRPKYNGKVALANNILWFEPEDSADDYVAELVRQLGGGMYSHPIYSKSGGWPPVIEKIIEQRSKEEGYKSSRLPAFSKEEIKLIRGTYDFYGLNYYTSRIARWAKSGEEIGTWPHFGTTELNISLIVKPEWKQAPPNWFYIYPEGIRRQMKWLKDQYGDVEIFIAENGYANHDPKLNDWDRVKFFKDHLEQVLLSIHEDGVNVTRYTAWSMMDNYEWIDGYYSKFGLYAVDFNDTERKRTPRRSAYYYANVIRNNSLTVPPSFGHYRSSSQKKSNSPMMMMILLIMAINIYL